MRNLAGTLLSSVHSFGIGWFSTAAQASVTTVALAAGALWVANLGDGRIRAGVPRTGGEAGLGEISQHDEPIQIPPPQDTIFIVGSEEEARLLCLRLAEDAAVRSAAGLAPVRDEVVIAVSVEEARLLRAAIEEGNRILADQHAGELRIIDLVDQGSTHVATQGPAIP